MTYDFLNNLFEIFMNFNFGSFSLDFVLFAFSTVLGFMVIFAIGKLTIGLLFG